MGSKSNRGFSLLEVVISAGIFTAGIVFIFQAFTTITSSSRLSRALDQACLIAEARIWDLECSLKGESGVPAQPSGKETLEGRDFEWNYAVSPEEGGPVGLQKIEFNVSWQDRGKQYPLKVLTYLFKKQG